MAKVELTGVKELLNEVEKLGAKGNQIENKALREAGALMKESIAREAPRRTGKLKKSIEVSGVRTKDGMKHVQVGPGKDGYYGKFVEFGTVKMRARPFMAPGYENAKSQALDKIAQELRKGLGL